MDSVFVAIAVEHPSMPGNTADCQVQAGTGATLTVLPGDLLVRLGVMPQGTKEFKLADGRLMSRPVGEARIRMNGDAVVGRVVFGEPGDASLLGVTVLEGLGLMVDPVERRLVPTTYQLF
jgi:predicted aspartyl protease